VTAAPGAAGLVLALDVGGTKLAAGLVDGDGRVVHAERRPTPHGPADDAAAGLRAVHGLLDSVLAATGRPRVAGVGIGCGGPMRWPAGEVSPVNLPAWRHLPLRAAVAERFPGLPVRLHNDAVCLAAAEHWRGAGRGVDDMLGMVVSTGVGGGLVLGGRLVDGATGNAGHVGHVVVEPDGPDCKCGGRGCLEAIARGPALPVWARERGWRPGEPDATARELADDARRGDRVAVAAFARAGRAVGVALASVVHLLDVRLVSVGGGVAQAGPLLFEPLREVFARHCRLSYADGARVVPAALGQDAGLVGAAALVLAGDRYWSAD
jgi:glucokinase